MISTSSILADRSRRNDHKLTMRYWDTMNICLWFHWSFINCCSWWFLDILTWGLFFENEGSFVWGTHVDLCRSRNVVLFFKVCIGQKPQAFRGSPNRECDIVDGFRYCYCECHTYHIPCVTWKSGLCPSTHVSTTFRYFGTRIVNHSSCCCQQISWTFPLLHPLSLKTNLENVHSQKIAVEEAIRSKREFQFEFQVGVEPK